MRKSKTVLFRILVTFCIIGSLMFCLAACSLVSGLWYALAEDGQSYILMGCRMICPEQLEIPDTYKGLPVTAIAEKAFIGNETIKSVIVPGSITRIEKNAFSNCKALESVTLSEGVSQIGQGAFSGCSALKSIELPDSLSEIGYAAFMSCTAAFEIVDDVHYIGAWCVGAEKSFIAEHRKDEAPLIVTIREGTVGIADYAFSSPTSGAIQTTANSYVIDEITIPNDVKYIGKGSFYYCKSLYRVTVGTGVEAIGDCAFTGCYALDSITYTGSLAQWEAISKPDTWGYIDEGKQTPIPVSCIGD